MPGFVTVAALDGRSVRAEGSAAAVWAVLPAYDEAPIGLDEVVAVLAAEHGANPHDVCSDTKRVLAAWEAIGCAVLEP